MTVKRYWRELACVAFGIAAFALGFYLVYLQWWVHPEMTRPLFFWAYWQLIAIDVMLLGAAVLWFEAAIRGNR
jgi:hypothetical protein